jgi:two-component system, chemotaxis family, protein-glutamate methylesterase/glutaminase
MRTTQLVVVGASAGGIEALRELAGGLPAGFPVPVAIVLHIAPESPGLLAEILNRSGPLSARNARDRDRLEPGSIYLAPPDYHMLIEPGLVRVTKGPRENRFRPAIDPLFRSAAQVYGPAAIGVVLTGNLDDGTAGLWAIKQLGGTAIVQDPGDAVFPSMPKNALAHVRADHVVPLAALAPLLTRLTAEAVPDAPPVPVPAALEVEVRIAKQDPPLDTALRDVAEPSTFACPECHGVLLQLNEGGRTRFRCHTGHAYSAESLAAGIDENVEEALWNAIRSLEEADMLLRSMAEHVRMHAQGDADPLLARADEAKQLCDVIRKLAMQREPLTTRP